MVLKSYLFIALGVLVVSCNSGTTTDTTGEQSQSYIPNGEQLYLKNCIACHGVDGTSQKSGSKDLSKSTLPYAEVLKMIEVGGGNGMPRFKEILGKEGEVEAVAEHVMQLRTRI